MSIDKTRVYESGFASAVDAVVGFKRAIDLVEFSMVRDRIFNVWLACDSGLVRSDGSAFGGWLRG
ncbi:MAG: hypothetical protein U7126_03520 [Microcoleus sp.]